MSAWRSAIFSNDEAMDVRDDYREMIVMGFTDEDAEQRIIEKYAVGAKSLPNNFWLPLAVTQWKAGRLSERVKENALAVIAEELTALEEIWEPQIVKRRRASLMKARGQICSPMPPRRKLRVPNWAVKCSWEPGNTLQYRLDNSFPSCKRWSGKYILLHVAGKSERESERVPLDVIEVCLYQWVSEIAPTPEEIARLRGKLPLVPFRSNIGVPIRSMTLLPEKQYVLRNDIKLVSETPLFPEPAWERLPAGCPVNFVMEEYIGFTLETFAD